MAHGGHGIFRILTQNSILKKKICFQNNVQFNAFESHKLSYHKTVVGDYDFVFLKWLETVVTNHGFNFKLKLQLVTMVLNSLKNGQNRSHFNFIYI